MSVIGGAMSRCDNSNLSLNINKTKRTTQSSLRSASMATQRSQWGAPGPLGCTTDDLRCSTDTTPSCHKGHTNVWQMKRTHAPLPVLTAFYMETLGTIISVASVHPGTVVLSRAPHNYLVDISVFYTLDNDSAAYSARLLKKTTLKSHQTSHFPLFSTLNLCTVTQINKIDHKIRFRVRNCVRLRTIFSHCQ